MLNEDTLNLVKMAQLAMDAGTINGSPATMTTEEIQLAWTLALIKAYVIAPIVPTEGDPQ